MVTIRDPVERFAATRRDSNSENVSHEALLVNGFGFLRHATANNCYDHTLLTHNAGA